MSDAGFCVGTYCPPLPPLWIIIPIGGFLLAILCLSTICCCKWLAKNRMYDAIDRRKAEGLLTANNRQDGDDIENVDRERSDSRKSVSFTEGDSVGVYDPFESINDEDLLQNHEEEEEEEQVQSLPRAHSAPLLARSFRSLSVIHEDAAHISSSHLVQGAHRDYTSDRSDTSVVITSSETDVAYIDRDENEGLVDEQGAVWA